MRKSVWLVGAGPMAQAYIHVLKTMDVSLQVIGRSEQSAQVCEAETGVSVITGGLEHFLQSHADRPCDCAIVAVGAEALYTTTKALLNANVKQILVEKPAALHQREFDDLVQLSELKNATVLVGYNRRFYASVLKAEEIISQDAGVTSFNFEFTEWGHKIAPLKKAPGVKEKWFLANSTHVVDLAFYLGGLPKEISTHSVGGVDWHPSGSIFSGSGVSTTGAPFSYQANWESAGRWSVEILTKNHRLFFSPMEKLKIQKKGEIEVKEVLIDEALDLQYKPGLYQQVASFLAGDYTKFQTILGQATLNPIYSRMAGY